MGRLAGQVVANHFVGALLEGVVGEIRFPLDDGRSPLHLIRRGHQGLVDIWRRLCKCASRKGERTNNDHAFHSVTSKFPHLNEKLSCWTCSQRPVPERSNQYILTQARV